MGFDKNEIGFCDDKPQKWNASTSHDKRTQGKGKQKMHHDDEFLHCPKAGMINENKVKLVFICHDCGRYGHICPYCYELFGKESQRERRNSNISWVKRTLYVKAEYH